jgi:hypothetical protein
LLAVVIATAAVVTFDLDGRYGIAVIGPVPSGLPDLALPDPAELPRLVLPALGVLLVAYTDFILTARAFADRADRTAALDPDREFLALGAANLGAGVLHGFPVSSSTSRTALAASPVPYGTGGLAGRAQSGVLAGRGGGGAGRPAIPQPAAGPHARRRARRARRLRRGPHDRRRGHPPARLLPAP